MSGYPISAERYVLEQARLKDHVDRVMTAASSEARDMIREGRPGEPPMAEVWALAIGLLQLAATRSDRGS